ncbi:MAG: hypothetical protein ABI877_08130 [Gemmatimonadaceae bacterium]
MLRQAPPLRLAALGERRNSLPSSLSVTTYTTPFSLVARANALVHLVQVAFLTRHRAVLEDQSRQDRRMAVAEW